MHVIWSNPGFQNTNYSKLNWVSKQLKGGSKNQALLVGPTFVTAVPHAFIIGSVFDKNDRADRLLRCHLLHPKNNDKLRIH